MLLPGRMVKLMQDIQKFLKKYDIKVSESTVSMVLGAIVVLVVGVLAYNYFRLNRQVTPADVSTTKENESGDLTLPGSAVALPTTHAVTEGETLWTIAEKYYSSGYNWVDVAQVNQLWNPNYLQVGQQLTIPKVEIRKELSVGGPAIYPALTDSKIEGTAYTVIKGDNLWDIAIRAYGDGFKWIEIAKASNLVNPGFIHAGNVLTLPR